MKSPLLPSVDQAASSSDSPLQFVMYLRNFCLYTNFSPPALTPHLPRPSPLTTARFIPCPRRFVLISFLMSENYLCHLHASAPFDQNAPLYHPCLVPAVYLLATSLITSCVTQRLSFAPFAFPFFRLSAFGQ